MSKATLYLEDSVHLAIRLKAAETGQSMSDLVNDALRAALREDLDDIADWNERRQEPTVSYDEMLKSLRADGTI